MTSEKIFCQSCGASINESSVFCKECGRPVYLYEKNIIQRLNDRINLLSILLGFLSTAIFLILGSLFFNLFLSNGIIDFITYIGVTIITALFFGGLTIGIAGCSDYHDAKSNSIAFILIILDIFAILFGLGFSTTIGLSSAISSIFGGSNSQTPTSLYEPSSATSNSNSSAVLIFQVLIIAILSIAAGIGGCYLGVFLKKFIADD